MPARLTVLMPVFNAEAFLATAIDSILAQTYPHFELLVVDDGSTDQSAAIAQARADTRIRFRYHTANCGIVSTLNEGLEQAQGEYIARADADDASRPERFQRQLAFMDAHPDVGICGAWLRAFGALSAEIWRFPCDDATLRSSLLFENVVMHPAAMFRRSVFIHHGLRYPGDYPHAEDYALWAMAAGHTALANVPAVLVDYRRHLGQVGSVHRQTQRQSCQRVREAQLRQWGVEFSPEELVLHNALGDGERAASREFVLSAERWLRKLHALNEARGHYPSAAFARVLGGQWYAVCLSAARLGGWAYEQFWRSPLGQWARIGPRRWWRLTQACWLIR